jgi:hypothetical protein
VSVNPIGGVNLAFGNHLFAEPFTRVIQTRRINNLQSAFARGFPNSKVVLRKNPCAALQTTEMVGS